MTTEQDAIRLRIDWETDGSKRAEYVNHLVLAFDGTVYTLRFYQVLPPLELAAKTANLQEIDAVSGRHIITMVVTPADLPGIAAVLSNALQPPAQLEGSQDGPNQ